MHHLQVMFKKISTVILTIKEIKLLYVFTHQTIALTSTVNGTTYISTNISFSPTPPPNTAKSIMLN